MKIAFLTSRDPQKKDSWSTITFFMAKALQTHCGEVSYIGSRYVPPKEEMIGRFISRCTRLLFKKHYNYFLSFLMSKRYAKIAERQLAGQRFDVIVAPMGWAELAFLKTDIPTVFVGDSTLRLLFHFYPACSNLVDASFREMDALEKRVTSKTTTLIYSSSWAAQSAINTYQADPAKVDVVPMGANFDTPPDREIILRRRKSSSCRLLFIGLDWQRKGGEIAFETLLALEEMGIMAELVICGCTPPKQFVHERMQVIPFLNKHDPEQYKKLVQLYLATDFLLLPTRYDCTPIVFCEANAYGLPVITTHVGGIPEMIRDGENGFMLPLAARGDEYAKVIASVHQDDERFTRLVYSSRAAYDERLNWDAWGMAMNTILSEVVDQAKGYEFDLEQEGQLAAFAGV